MIYFGIQRITLSLLLVLVFQYRVSFELAQLPLRGCVFDQTGRWEKKSQRCWVSRTNLGNLTLEDEIK